MTRLLGAVLAGGRARRFGGDKAVALLAGRSLLDHAVAALAPLVDEVAIVGRTHPGLTSLEDWPSPGLGPLGGLCGALRHAACEGFAGVLAIGCDTPVVERALLRRLADMGRPCFARDLPVIGYWPSALAPALSACLAAPGDRSVRGWGATAGALAIDAPGVIANINRPGDLAALEAGLTP